MSNFKPSPLQEAIYTWIRTGTGSAVVKAVAGSGKSTTILNGVEFIPPTQRVIMLAFNKPIATELTEKLTQRKLTHVRAATLNSAGNGALRKFLLRGSRGFIKIDGNKTRDLARVIVTEDVKYYYDEIIKLVSLAKAFGIVPSYVRSATGIMPDTMESWYFLIDRYDLEVSASMVPAVIDTVREILMVGLRERNVIDYDDQLYMPVVLGAPFETYDWLFVDEAQDVSPIQRAMLRKMLRAGGRLVAVGDEAQAIYGFRGADSDSLRNIIKEFNAVELPLSISYRCPQNVVRFAQRVVPHIEASPTAKEGTVMSWLEYDGTEFEPEDMVVCRNTAPLIRLAYGLIGRRIPVRVMGRDIGSGLVKLIDKLKPKGIQGEHGLIAKLDAWKSAETQKLLTQGKEDKIQSIEDKFDSLMAFIDNALADTVPKLKEAIESMFARQNDPGAMTTLCTIHKSKGLEAQRVFVLDDWLMPSKWARQAWQVTQEFNLMYVAYTRAQSDLIFIDTKRLVSRPAAKEQAA